MKETYYGVFRRVCSESEGEIIEILKDPSFCQGKEKPFETFITIKDDFLPWETIYKYTALAQAELLSQRDKINYGVWKHEIDSVVLLRKMQIIDLN